MRLTQYGDKILQDITSAMISDCENAYFQIYAGPVPAGPRSSLGGVTLLHQCRLASPAAPAASLTTEGISINFNAFTTESTIASGTASFARIYDSTGAQCLFQLTVGVSADNPNVVLPSLEISAGVSWTPGAFTLPIASSSSGV